MNNQQSFLQYYASVALLSSLIADKAAKEIKDVSKKEIMDAQGDVVQALTMIQLAKNQFVNFENNGEKIGLAPNDQNQTKINNTLRKLQNSIMDDIDRARDKPTMDLVVQALRYIGGLYLFLFFQLVSGELNEEDKIYVSLASTLMNDAQNTLSQRVIPYLYDFYR